ncbi:hypothetical protein ACO2Q1_16080 [Brevundimonas sp. VNH65]|uniref:hypothetical protein n=1 Tax=Brevundimonas sp. VNH65 TaxID=3400917 RepID=UPI003C10A829
MAGLTVEARTALARVLDAVPDEAMAVILSVVRCSAGQRAREVEALLHDAVEDRRRRTEAFGALAPLFRRRSDDLAALNFPSPVLARLWRAAVARDRDALVLLDRIGDDQATFHALGRTRLYDAAIAVLDQKPESVWAPASDMPEDDWREGVAELRACCALGLLAHRSMGNLPGWIDRPDEDLQAELKLALRDASESDPEGPRRLVDILVAHLDRTEDVVRLAVNAATAMGHEAMLRHSELALYIERALSALETRVQRILGWRPGDPRDALERDLAAAGAVVGTLELTAALDGQEDWMRRLAGVKSRVSGMIEDRLQATVRSVARILPTRGLQTAGRMSRKVADPNAAIDDGALAQARGLIDLARAVRSAASRFGCESRRHGVVEEVAGALAQHIDQLVEAVHGGDAADPAATTARLLVLSDLLERLGDDAEARTARRRIAALNQSGDVRAA